MNTPKLMGIDHFHLYVTDKRQAARWYKEILGFETVQSMLSWDVENGPLTIEDPSGEIHLALFTRKNQQPSTSIAFKTSGEEFLRWANYLKSNDLKLRIADHQIAWSIYFKDLDENMHEITTYDYQMVSEKINESSD